MLTSAILFVAGCSESSTGPDHINYIDPRSGNVIMGGRITIIDISNGEDTVSEENSFIDFVMYLKMSSDKEDTIRFYGLEGADVTKLGHNVFPGCTHPDDCPVFGRMTTKDTFEICISNNGRSYSALGNLSTGFVELEGIFKSETVSISYDLKSTTQSPMRVKNF